MFYEADLARVKSTGGAVGKAVQPPPLPPACISNSLSAIPWFCSKAGSSPWSYQGQQFGRNSERRELVKSSGRSGASSRETRHAALPWGSPGQSQEGWKDKWQHHQGASSDRQPWETNLASARRNA